MITGLILFCLDHYTACVSTDAIYAILHIHSHCHWMEQFGLCIVNTYSIAQHSYFYARYEIDACMPNGSGATMPSLYGETPADACAIIYYRGGTGKANRISLRKQTISPATDAATDNLQPRACIPAKTRADGGRGNIAATSPRCLVRPRAALRAWRV